jgi:hypothetical protein
LHVAAAGIFSAPTTIKVLIAREGLIGLAHITIPEELRTAPGVTATALIEEGTPAKRAAISNTEIGPAASSSWKSGKTSCQDGRVKLPSAEEKNERV